VDDSAPQITVVIPLWGSYAGKQFDAALSSLQAQDVRLSIVVVDNADEVPVGATGGARVVRSRTRLTLGAARNLGLSHVKTPYVMFWDADDVMLPDTLPRLQAMLDRDPRLVAAGAAIVEEPGGRRHRWPRRWIATLIQVPVAAALIDSVWSIFPTTGATLMRTDAVRTAAGFSDADSGEDWCLGAALVWQGRLAWTESPGRVYVRHAGSTWDGHSSAGHQFRHARAVRARLRQHGVAPDWVAHCSPLIAVAQWGAIGAHVAVGEFRRRRVSRGAV